MAIFTPALYAFRNDSCDASRSNAPDRIGDGPRPVNEIADRQRRAPVDAPLDHGLDRFLVQHVAVLDRIDACAKRDPVAGRCHGMRRDFPPRAMRLIDDGAHLVDREIGQAPDRAVGVRVIATIGVDLDPVGAVVDLVAHGLPATIGAVTHLDTPWHVQLPGVARQTICAGRRQRLRRDEETRTLDDAALDCLLQIDVGEPGPLVADVPHCREAVVERDPERARRAQRAKWHRLLQ